MQAIRAGGLSDGQVAKQAGHRLLPTNQNQWLMYGCDNLLDSAATCRVQSLRLTAVRGRACPRRQITSLGFAIDEMTGVVATMGPVGRRSQTDLADDAGRGVGRDHIAALLVSHFASERLHGRCATHQHVAERLGAGDRVVESINGLGDVVRVLGDGVYDGLRLLAARCGRHRFSPVGVLLALPLRERLDAPPSPGRITIEPGSVTASPAASSLAARRHGHGQGSIVISNDAHNAEYPFRTVPTPSASPVRVWRLRTSPVRTCHHPPVGAPPASRGETRDCRGWHSVSSQARPPRQLRFASYWRCCTMRATPTFVTPAVRWDSLNAKRLQVHAGRGRRLH